MYVYMCSHENNVPSWLSPQSHNRLVAAHALGHIVFIIAYILRQSYSCKI